MGKTASVNKAVHDKLAGKCYAVYDARLNRYLYSGRNAATEERAVDDAWTYWISGAYAFTEAEIKRMNEWIVQDKKKWLEGSGLLVKRLDEKLPAEDDL